MTEKEKIQGGKLVADCCDGASWQYMLIGGEWYLVTWAQIGQDKKRTTWQTQAFPATHCHQCGGLLEKADRRNYFPGTFAPIDSVVEAKLEEQAMIKEAEDAEV